MFLRDLARRQAAELSPEAFSRRYHVTGAMVERLGMHAELEGHQGCVNCLQWNRAGDRLLSGSDDLHVVLWDPLRLKELLRLKTEHTGNIFSVKFMPMSYDNLVASGAADSKVQVHDLGQQKSVALFGNHHYGRVKGMDVANDSAHLFWSAAEDGLVMQFDLRCDNYQPHVMVNLNATIGDHAEAKCVSINQSNTNVMAIGANDEFVRLYDRRFVKARKMPQEVIEMRSTNERHNYLVSTLPHVDLSDPTAQFNHMRYLVPGHLTTNVHKSLNGRRRTLGQGMLTLRRRPYTTTYACFSPSGDSLLANLGGEQVYLFPLSQPRSSLLLSTVKLGKDADSGETSPFPPPALSDEVMYLKERANSEYNEKNFFQAIYFYNLAIARCRHPVLLSNRAAATLKRNWSGDPYNALRDCQEAVNLDESYVKAHLRLVQSLLALDLPDRAESYLIQFKAEFVEHSDSSFISTLEQEIKDKLLKQKEKAAKEKADDDLPNDDPNQGEPHAQVPLDTFDFEKSFCGHCNTTTDIKEASFFGSDGQFVAAGSDDGKLFVWETESTNLVRVFEGDESIVNCVQSHPSACILATSGIDPQVRLWSPFAENGEKNPRVIEDHFAVSSANQRRMNADPFETLLMNMGMAMEPGGTDEEGEGEAGQGDDRGLQCRTS